MRKPRALTSGDRIAVVAPASAFDAHEFHAGVRELATLGFEPVYDESVFERQREYLAGSAETRAAAIRRAWTDPSIAALVAVRGGFGSAHVLPLLDAAELQRTPKAFIGFSDITTLLTYLTLGCDLVSFHGPMLEFRFARGEDGYDRQTFERALCRPEPMGELSPPGVEVIRPGEAAGMLVGGTLTQLLASLGTPFAFAPPPGCVLFLDEVGERPYRLDRMMTQLAQTGLLARASAIVLGELPRCDEPTGNVLGRSVMTDLLADFPGPVLIGFPSGHTEGPTLTLPFGVRARVIAGPTPRLVIEEAAVQ
jgi:muramoyltetrapeptide carboxypeptidase